MVKVLLYGLTLRQSVQDDEVELEVTDPMSVRTVLELHQDKLGPALSFATKGELLVTVNKKVSTLESMVKDGDTVKLTHQFNPSYDGARWHNP